VCHDDDVYYKVTRAVPLAQRLTIFARRRMFDLFMDTMAPTDSTTILDIGTSEKETREANILEKLYPWPSQITCASLGSGAAITAAHPDVRHVPIEPGQKLPFGDCEFDIAYSNAVLEHVGGSERRRVFLLEAQRVSRAIFVLVPNRWFPVEHHTGIPFLHWSPTWFRRTLKNGPRSYWSRVENLDFLSASLLRYEWPLNRPISVKYAGLPLGPLSSNLAIIFDRANYTNPPIE